MRRKLTGLASSMLTGTFTKAANRSALRRKRPRRLINVEVDDRKAAEASNGYMVMMWPTVYGELSKREMEVHSSKERLHIGDDPVQLWSFCEHGCVWGWGRPDTVAIMPISPHRYLSFYFNNLASGRFVRHLDYRLVNYIQHQAAYDQVIL